MRKVEFENVELHEDHEVPSHVSDDPVRTYLTDMGKIPLLSREQEIKLAKRIEVTRTRFRRAVLGSHFALYRVVEILKRVNEGTTAFDRTIEVVATENREKEQILRRMPENLAARDGSVGEESGRFPSLLARPRPCGPTPVAGRAQGPPA